MRCVSLSRSKAAASSRSDRSLRERNCKSDPPKKKSESFWDIEVKERAREKERKGRKRHREIVSIPMRFSVASLSLLVCFFLTDT